MISCDFCAEDATYAYAAAGIVWPGCPERVHFCREHLTTYYLGLHYALGDDA